LPSDDVRLSVRGLGPGERPTLRIEIDLSRNASDLATLILGTVFRAEQAQDSTIPKGTK
jgi:hypothetical protein